MPNRSDPKVITGHIATPDGRGWREESGDAGLGTSGSSDVRAGLLDEIPHPLATV